MVILTHIDKISTNGYSPFYIYKNRFLMIIDQIQIKYLYQESPSAKCQRAGVSKLPLMDSFRTFKGDMISENIKLNQLILQC